MINNLNENQLISSINNTNPNTNNNIYIYLFITQLIDDSSVSISKKSLF